VNEVNNNNNNNNNPMKIVSKSNEDNTDTKGRFTSAPLRDANDDDDIPAFLRLERKKKAADDVIEKSDESADTSLPFQGSFSSACPACGKAHSNVTLTRADDGNSMFACPETGDSVISTPECLILNPIQMEQKSDQVEDAGNIHLAAQITVEAAVRAPIRSQYSKKMFSIIEDATKRLGAVEKRKQILREEIEEAQNELASLTTESDLLRDTIDRFKSNALDDDSSKIDEDSASSKTRRRVKKKTASGNKSATARRKPPKTFLKETADDNSVSADEKS
jgi:predicted RNA-binding Zn-ribbon protein involved in translation (DUF1610 family)